MQFPKGFIDESKPLSKKERKITHSHQREKSNYNQNKQKQLDLHHDAWEIIDLPTNPKRPME